MTSNRKQRLVLSRTPINPRVTLEEYDEQTGVVLHTFVLGDNVIHEVTIGEANMMRSSSYRTVELALKCDVVIRQGSGGSS